MPSMGIPFALGRVFNKVCVYYLVGNAIHVPYMGSMHRLIIAW